VSAGRTGSWLRGLTGLLAGGLVALAVALTVGWVIADRTGSPGPGPATLVWHGAAAVAAVVAQLYADRHDGRSGLLAAVAVALITAVVLAVQWLA
jgi:steroid 5-alpha reductase family enzyme